MTAIPKIKLESVERFERDYKLRLPFRFGVITVTAGTQAVIRAKVALEDGRTAVGVAAEALGAKWFDKSPAFSDAQNLDIKTIASCHSPVIEGEYIAKAFARVRELPTIDAPMLPDQSVLDQIVAATSVSA